MNPEIKNLLDELRAFALKAENENPADMKINPARRAAFVLQAVFDPENQPSQYGTTLVPK